MMLMIIIIIIINMKTTTGGLELNRPFVKINLLPTSWALAFQEKKFEYFERFYWLPFTATILSL
jgi:hypothetical protein